MSKRKNPVACAPALDQTRISFHVLFDREDTRQRIYMKFGCPVLWYVEGDPEPPVIYGPMLAAERAVQLWKKEGK